MRLLAPTAALIAVFFVLSAATARDARADAEQFTSLHCNKCHEISALKIEKDKKKGDDDEDEDDDTPPDLSHTGKFHDAKFLKPFLLKESDHVAHDGNTKTKKHPKKFKGSDEELDKMSGWLATLK